MMDVLMNGIAALAIRVVLGLGLVVIAVLAWFVVVATVLALF